MHVTQYRTLDLLHVNIPLLPLHHQVDLTNLRKCNYHRVTFLVYFIHGIATNNK